MKVCAVILAAGSSERFGADKLSQDLHGLPVWQHSFEAFLSHPQVDAVGIVARAPFDYDRAQFVVKGGNTRQESARAAVHAAEGFDVVLLHDAARPIIDQQTITRVIEAIAEHGAAAPAVSVTDTIRDLSGPAAKLLDRSKLVAMQTPQGARRELFVLAYDRAGQDFTDDVALLESAGVPVKLVEGNPQNMKVTYPSDLPSGIETRTGIGYDVHRFAEDPTRPLVLGGELFEGEVGLEGHSDADALLHAITDALLGAAALGDIGQHFPNTDPKWKNQPSTLFLKHAAELLEGQKWRIVNVDATVIAERPKIMPKADLMRAHVAKAVGLSIERVSIKATTNEGLGAIGRGEGIAAFATATITR